MLLPACIALAINTPTAADEINLPLLKQAKVLQCARTQPEAKAALSRFWDNADSNLQLPVESVKDQPVVVHAATLDIVLKSLLDTAQRHPELRNQVERTLLQWNYCDVFEKGVFFDVQSKRSRTERIKASYDSPESWQGFRALGFLGETEGRFIPDLISLDQNSLRADYEQFFHRIYREQCFPHPDTSELFDITEFDVLAKVSPAVGEHKEYPHAWDSECLYPREAPLLQTQLKIENVPLLVPTLKTLANVEDVPLLAPRLNVLVKTEDASQLVPSLDTEVSLKPQTALVPRVGTKVAIEVVEQLVPALSTDVGVEIVKLDVPELVSKVEIEEMELEIPTLVSVLGLEEIELEIPALASVLELEEIELEIPTLASVLELEETELEIPALASVLEIEEIELDIPELSTRLEIEELELNIPVLHSSVEFDQAEPKVFVKPTPKAVAKPIVIASAGGGVGGYGGSGGFATGGVVKTVAAPAPVAVQPVVQKVVTTTPVVQAAPTVIVNKDASLLERLLTGLNGRNNVLIIDKIQLTVNEYNGTVETAISSSDIGTATTVTDFDTTALVKELMHFDNPKAESQEKTFVKKPHTVKPKKIGPSPKIKTSTAKYANVPALESILIVSPVSYVAKPKPVVISKPSYQPKMVKAPSLKSKVVVNKKPVVKAKKKITQTKKKREVKANKSSGSGLFVYQPYKNGDKPSAKEKSVEELLREYAEYEARRKSGRAGKKKVNTDVKLATESKEKQTSNNAQHSKSKKVSDGKVANAEGEIALSSNKEKPESKTSFVFTDAEPDYPDVKQVTAVTTNTPVGLTTEAPLPYVIEENFINDQEAEVDKTKKKKEKEKKPIGLAGNVYLKKSLGSGKWGIGGSINRKLIKDKYWFARVGWSYSLEEEDDPFSYSWGIGYSDWHAGTFSAQLNNWGPIKMGEGLALDKAIASFGYSVKSDLLKKYRLSLSGALNIPIDGNSSAAVNMRWSPFENWYINASVSQPLEGGGDPKWSYGFGYSDWRPNKFNLQYSNYGPNDLFYHNFQKSGTWSLSYNWKF